MDESMNLASVASQWEKVKSGLYGAIVGGLGNWLGGRGAPNIVFNPFRALTPGASYGPQNYEGVGKMGQRLRLAEDEGSLPMKVIRTAVEKNPLLGGVQVLPGYLKGAESAGGSITWGRQTGKPYIALAPRVSPNEDPLLTLTHEAVGHGSHGPIVGKTPEDDKDFVTPRREGFAVGVEKGIYEPLGLALPSAYDTEYKNRAEYRRAQELGRLLAGHVSKNGEIPPQAAVLYNLFGNGQIPQSPPRAAKAGGS